jgi:hypothetical protein
MNKGGTDGPDFGAGKTAVPRRLRRPCRGHESPRNPINTRFSVVPVERIELPTFGLQNRLSVNRISRERVPKAKFVDSIIGYFESRN